MKLITNDKLAELIRMAFNLGGSMAMTHKRANTAVFEAREEMVQHALNEASKCQ